jgi:hypothetical protein
MKPRKTTKGANVIRYLRTKIALALILGLVGGACWVYTIQTTAKALASALEPKKMVYDNSQTLERLKIAEAKQSEAEEIPETPLTEKIKKAFPEHSAIALAVAQAESGLEPTKESDTDRMRDGRAFSFGLFQINITVHKLAGLDCPSAFSGKDYEAKVVNEAIYKACADLAKDVDVNIETAKGIYGRSGKGFGRWGAFTNGSYLKYMK